MRDNIEVPDYGASAAIGSVVTLVITKGFPWLLKVYERRNVDPKRAYKQLFVEQAAWFTERAEKLALFRWELTHHPPRDKFKLAYLVSKLDRRDAEWAMKEADIEVLCDYAVHKGAECQENARECARNADEIHYRTFVFPLS